MDQAELYKIVKNANKFLVNRPSLSMIGMVYYGLTRTYAVGDSFHKMTGGRPCLAYTDGSKIVFYIPEKDFKLEHFIFVAAHEVLHIISDHISRAVGRKPFLWNLAADHVVNRLCMDLGSKNGIMEAPEGVFFLKDLDDKEPNISAERVYDYLMKNESRFEISVIGIDSKSNRGQKGSKGKKGSGEESGNGSNSGEESGNGSDSGEESGNGSDSGEESGNGSDSGSNESENSCDDEKDETDRKKVIVVKDKHTGKTYYSMDDTDISKLDKNKNDIKDKMTELRENAQGLWRSGSMDKGDYPGGFVTYLDDIFKIEIPWESILEEAILYPITACKKVSWSFPNIYIRNPMLPGRSRSKGYFTLIAGIDTSGSVGDEDLKKFVGIICSSYPYFKKIITINHDYVVQEEIVITGIISEASIFDKIRGLKGRGGTSHKDIFDRIELLSGEEKLSSVIFLTDFYSDVEEIYTRYSWIKDIETSWVLTNNEKCEVILNGCKTKTIHIN